MKFEILQNGELIDSKELPEGSWKIGRASGCDIQLKSAQVSKQHALLVVKGNKAAIVDLGSSNGVFVNGILVRKQRLEQTDEVSIADFYIRIAKPARIPPNAARSRAPAIDGNLAMSIGIDSSPQEELVAAPELSPQDKLLQVLDNRVLAPMYSLMRSRTGGCSSFPFFSGRWLLCYSQRDSHRPLGTHDHDEGGSRELTLYSRADGTRKYPHSLRRTIYPD